MGTEMVNLYVGPGKRKFLVHKEILCSKVLYFEKMFKGGFEEATKNEATFPEDDAESFDLLLSWVYHDSIRRLVVLRKDSINEGVVIMSWTPIKFYMLTEKFCLSVLQDRIVNIYLEYLDRENKLPSVIGMAMTYSTTPTGNPFRKFITRSFYWVMDSSSKLINPNWPTHALAKLMRDQEDLAEEVLTLIRTGVKASDPRTLPRCEFHCHGKDEPCPTKKDSMA
jgi:hypothetical protein